MSQLLSTGSFDIKGITLCALLVNQKANKRYSLGIYLFIQLVLQVASCERLISTFKLLEKTH